MRASSPTNPVRRAVGWLLLGGGLVFNRWTVERVVAWDEHISSPSLITALGVGQGLLLAAAVWLLSRRIVPRVAPAVLFPVGLIANVVGLAGVGVLLGVTVPRQRPARIKWETMAKTEDTLLELEVVARALSADLDDLDLPSAGHRKRWFAPEVEITDIALASDALRESFRFEPVPRRPTRDFSLWRPLLDRTAYVDHAQFKLKGGAFDPRGRFVATLSIG
ncbi:MAG: hypothetical protein AAGA56_20565, partial [Myxococcota bacterium]